MWIVEQWVRCEAVPRERQWRKYEDVSKSFRTGLLERELQMVQLSATRCSCIAIIVSQSSESCRHNTLCCFSTSVYCYCCLFRYRLSPETFGYTLVRTLNGARSHVEYSDEKCEQMSLEQLAHITVQKKKSSISCFCSIIVWKPIFWVCVENTDRPKE
jgi:hypothetical protein